MDAHRRDLSGEPAAMRALAHPVRLELIELLKREGPLTATEAGERLGQRPGNMSWHLQILARHGFVTEAGEKSGRRRPWRLTAPGLQFETDTPESRALLDAVVASDVAALMRAGSDAFMSRQTLYLTPDELTALHERVDEVFAPYLERVTDPSKRPPGSAPVRTILALLPEASA
ncbi:ArsR/SmtB family transcription factor [Dactylosporangium sp. CA-092794]|uniref:ArsR/SmtB family transcription factor n=1 Tax=Dactylosporangium sp. CA-092794 TaxID=3239929 RepID=UPI003D8FBDA8